MPRIDSRTQDSLSRPAGFIQIVSVKSVVKTGLVLNFVTFVIFVVNKSAG